MLQILVALVLLGNSATAQKINPANSGSPQIAASTPPHISNSDAAPSYIRGRKITYEPSISIDRCVPSGPNPIHHRCGPAPAPPTPPHMPTSEHIKSDRKITFEPSISVDRCVPSGPNPIHHPCAPKPAPSTPPHMPNSERITRRLIGRKIVDQAKPYTKKE
ncbi:unnamed protein product [Linum tenue]|uniref:Uncharacterized protein n=1 Tax=Linum tenue TaxID=586396 RepID=A0AAV0JQ18_9ROSI|nr:unnamed protein product [Linum tenue]